MNNLVLKDAEDGVTSRQVLIDSMIRHSQLGAARILLIIPSYTQPADWMGEILSHCEQEKISVKKMSEYTFLMVGPEISSKVYFMGSTTEPYLLKGRIFDSVVDLEGELSSQEELTFKTYASKRALFITALEKIMMKEVN